MNAKAYESEPRRSGSARLAVLLSLALLAGCGGGGGGESAAGPSLPEARIYSGVVDCAGTGTTGTLVATVLAPSAANIVIAAADVTLSGVLGIAPCTGLTGTAGTIEFRHVPVATYSVAVQKGAFNLLQTGVPVTTGVQSVTLRLSSTRVRLGVVRGEFDSIETVLGRLGFAWTAITKTDLNNDTVLSAYDYVFLDCGLDQVADPASLTLDVPLANAAADNLQRFVSAGKHLYASDWAYVYLEKAFPDAMDFFGDDANFAFTECDETQARIGDTGEVTASIHDNSLATALGRTSMRVNFDLLDWVVMGRPEAQGTGTAILTTGPVTACTQSRGIRPLSVKFPFGFGTVLFTSFHNSAQTTADMDRVLEDLIMN